MKRRKRSLKLKEVKTEETQQSYDEEPTWKKPLIMVKQTIWRGGQMLPICLHFCIVVSTFSYSPAGLLFVEFSTWSFLLLTTWDPL